MDPTTLWQENYAPRFAAARAREEQFRAEAFVEVPRQVAGEPLRLMTARDLHLLDGAGNAFVCGTQPTPGDLGVFVWQLHAHRPAGDGLRAAFFRGRLLGRLRRRRIGYLAAVEELRAYLEAVFFDAPAADPGVERRPFGGSFLVPLLGAVAAEVSPVDPVSGRPWGDVPLPQLFHWHKYAARLALGRSYTDRNPSDRILSEYLEELNR